MYDGLWAVEFKANNEHGSGVMVLNGGQVLGGDYGYYYSGRINTTGNVTGEVNVIRFNPNAVSVFGDVDSFTLVLTGGSISENTFQVNATVKRAEHLSIEINGQKKVDADEVHRI